MKYLFIFLCVIVASLQARADDVKYTFDIAHTIINKTGKNIKAMTIGGSLPAPLIEARLGDTLEVTFNNKMDVETSVHWHGILLPPDQDGVPFLNTKPIPAGGSFTFRFDITHTGTFWYHSHTGLQEERGLYGPIRLLPKMQMSHTQDKILVWSDWTDDDPDNILRNLKRDGDYYALKKGTVQSWDKVVANGTSAIKKRLSDAFSRMAPMDLSDVAYDAFLANGDVNHQLLNAKPGETVRVRMINAAASSYFNIEFSGGPMTIVSADGVDVEPLKVQRLQMAIAETYDVLVTIPDSGAYELRATSVDGSGYASAYLGEGMRHNAPDMPKPNPFAPMKMDMDMGDGAMTMDMPRDEDPMDMSMDHDTMDMDHDVMGMDMPMDVAPLKHMTNYSALRSPTPTTYDADLPLRKVHLNLTGNMERYIWSFNNKTMSEADRIIIKKGERVQFIFKNDTMMSHPLHLHGHFFRVLNGQGDYSPLKHTIDLSPMSSVTIEFAANEEADWIFHCHNLYHMKSGMARVISYQNSSRFDDKTVRSLSPDTQWFKFADLTASSNQHEGRLWMVNNRYSFEVEWEGDYDKNYEIEARGEYFINRFTEAFVGVEHEKSLGPEETVGYVGISYVLPMLIESEVRLDTNGHAQFGIGSSIQLLERTKFNWDWNTDNEYSLQLDYELSKRLSIIAKHHDDYDFGVGLKLKL